jgi:hypothetical protein
LKTPENGTKKPPAKSAGNASGATAISTAPSLFSPAIGVKAASGSVMPAVGPTVAPSA